MFELKVRPLKPVMLNEDKIIHLFGMRAQFAFRWFAQRAGVRAHRSEAARSGGKGGNASIGASVCPSNGEMLVH